MERTPDEAEALPQQPFRFVLHYLRHYRWALLLMASLEFGQAACQILIPSAIRQVIDAVGAGGASTAELLRAPLTFFVLLNVGILVCSRASGSVLVIVGPALRQRVRLSLFRYLQAHSQRYFAANFAGSLANRLSEVSMSVNHALWTVMFDFWPVTVALSVSLYLLAQAHGTLALVLGAWTLVYVVVSWLLAMKCRQYAQLFAAARSTVSGKIVDSVTNIMNTKLFARTEFERGYLGKYLDQEVKAARRTFWFMERMRWFQFIATLSLQIGMIFYATELWIEGQITVGTFAMVASLCLMFINDIRSLSRRFLEFFENVGNITDGVGIIVRPHEITDDADSPALVVEKGEIRFEGVHFAYAGGRPVFQGLDLTIRAGERVGLVGFSGSGKSTFVNLILRLYDVQSGRILLDGQDVRAVSQDSVRNAVSMIPQDPMLFHRSLQENIRYGRLEATEPEIQEAARKAHADEFIRLLPEGYDSLVGERGVRLSGGQRQRIAIARAVLMDAPILLMDEATSSLDSVTENHIQSSLSELMKDRTVVVIAHRLSTIAHLDRIIVFHAGEVVEDGTHAQLLEKRGYYARMWSMQAGGFLPERDSSEEEVVPQGANFELV